MTTCRNLAAALILVLALFTPGCGPRTIDAGTPMPDNLTIEIAGSTASGKQTYLKLLRSGDLYFGGGLAAINQTPTLACQLTPEQRRKVWQTIIDGQLLAVVNIPFEKPRDVRYDVSIKAGGYSRSYRTIDDRAPGVKVLHDLLFGYQADVRYNILSLPGSTQPAQTQPR